MNTGNRTMPMMGKSGAQKKEAQRLADRQAPYATRIVCPDKVAHKLINVKPEWPVVMQASKKMAALVNPSIRQPVRENKSGRYGPIPYRCQFERIGGAEQIGTNHSIWGEPGKLGH